MTDKPADKDKGPPTQPLPHDRHVLDQLIRYGYVRDRRDEEGGKDDVVL
jgi:hypothetical protein